jgi:hypothetical protein
MRVDVVWSGEERENEPDLRTNGREECGEREVIRDVGTCRVISGYSSY